VKLLRKILIIVIVLTVALALIIVSQKSGTSPAEQLADIDAARRIPDVNNAAIA